MSTEIFAEKLPPYILDSGVRSLRQVMIFVWLLRFFAAGLFIGVIIYHIMVSRYIIWVLDIGTILGVALTIIYSEILMRGEKASAFPISIYDEGIQTYPGNDFSSVRNRGFIKRNEIELIEIKRYQVYQRLTYDDSRGILWKDAPIEIVIHTKNGKKYRTGPKPPGQIIEIKEIMANAWKIPISDKGTGLGIAIEYRNGKQIDE